MIPLAMPGECAQGFFARSERVRADCREDAAIAALAEAEADVSDADVVPALLHELLVELAATKPVSSVGEGRRPLSRPR